MLQGSCHCGAIQWRFEGMPDSGRRHAVRIVEWLIGEEDALLFAGREGAQAHAARAVALRKLPVRRMAVLRRAHAASHLRGQRFAYSLQAELRHSAQSIFGRAGASNPILAVM